MVMGLLGCTVAIAFLAARILSDVREGARAAECQNNLRRIGLAMNQYYDENGKYPKGTVAFNPDLAPEERLSWVAALLPFPEFSSPGASKEGAHEREILDDLDFRQPWNGEHNREATAKYLKFCICPCTLDPGAAKKGAWTNYVGIAGVGRDAPLISDFHPPLLVPKDANAGLFGYDRFTTRADITGGLTRTLMVVETSRDLGPWAQGGPSTVRGIDPDDNPPIGPGRPFGGLHPGGVYVLMAGGSMEKKRNDTKPELWQDLARVSRANVQAPEPP
jgi:hypothetical protein